MIVQWGVWRSWAVDAETRKETAKIIRKLKIARAGKPTIRRKRGGLHIQVLVLKAPIVEAVPTTLIAPILEEAELESPTVEVDETGDPDDEILDSICGKTCDFQL